MELLDAAEARVLGSLLEKEVTTPENYPLSLNALVNACNQKSNREPVVDFDELTVRDALEGLRAKRLAFVIEGSRVTKYSQRLSESWNMGRREVAVLCTLLLRGPQTLGEIKDRSERMFAFTDLDETQRALERLAEWPGTGPLVRKLERQTGQKESRYTHLLAGEPDMTSPALADTGATPRSGNRVSELEEEVRSLRAEIDDLKARMERFEALLR